MRDATVYAVYVTDVEVGQSMARIVFAPDGDEAEQDDTARRKAASLASDMVATRGGGQDASARCVVQIREYGEFRLSVMSAGDEWTDHGRRLLDAASVLSESGVDVPVILDRDVVWPVYEIEIEIESDGGELVA